MEEPSVVSEPKPLNILMVDDEESIRETGRFMLIKFGHHVEIAENGAVAWEMFQGQPDFYDIVVTDLTLPKLSGLDLAVKIRGVNQSIPIILSSGNLEDKTQQEYYNLGITRFLPKPWTHKILLGVIDSEMDKLI